MYRVPLPGIGVSAETGEDMRVGRKLEVIEFMDNHESKAAPYLGVLALLHTSELVFWESYNAMEGLVERRISARSATIDEVREHANQASLTGDTQTEDLLEDELDEVYVSLSLTDMVKRPICNTFSRYMESKKSMRTHGTLHGQAIQSTPSTTDPDRPTDSEAGIGRDATLTAAVKHFPEIYTRIQRRLKSGDGIRTSFKTEVKSLVGLDVTNNEVAIMIKGVAALGASLKTIRVSDSGNLLREFKVVKRKSKSKRYRSKTSCDLPRTWLSSDEMDTGP